MDVSLVRPLKEDTSRMALSCSWRNCSSVIPASGETSSMRFSNRYSLSILVRPRMAEMSRRSFLQ